MRNISEYPVLKSEMLKALESAIEREMLEQVRTGRIGGIDAVALQRAHQYIAAQYVDAPPAWFIYMICTAPCIAACIALVGIWLVFKVEPTIWWMVPFIALIIFATLAIRTYRSHDHA